MAKSGSRSADDLSYERGMKKLKELLANPEEFEKWANAMLDESRRRHH
jgi:hypothetical protein